MHSKGQVLAAYDPRRYASLDGYAQDVIEICTALDLQARPHRKVGVDARSEANEAVGLAECEGVTDLGVADDPASDGSGDLFDAHRAIVDGIGHVDPELFVSLRAVGIAGVEVFADHRAHEGQAHRGVQRAEHPAGGAGQIHKAEQLPLAGAQHAGVGQHHRTHFLDALVDLSLIHI